ncbi:FHA domain-containing protein [Colwellia sp. E2M01]|uniref:FHA domain-containing protein n=1 Tax=Colwellia sp. E2M01 TaxID=2841561 RepID=UPI001C092F9A|nr:FHA domain-containing protein [Colwellia sp. E2M01]MBU2870624.1 FHA domain-containing protein [Colwellia sp. E2M01]
MEVINKSQAFDTSSETSIDSLIEDNTTSLADNNTPTIPGEIIIEEISRNHKLLHRHCLQQNNINIGRDYHNDIILTDPYICPKHLSFTFADGVWHVKDNDSVNGSLIEHIKSKKVKHELQAKPQVINNGDVISLGKSQLRILFKNHQVADTIPYSPFEYLIDLIRNPVAVVMSIALFMLIAAYNTYLNQSTEINISQLLVNAFTKGLLYSIWPASVALISHLTKNDPRTLAQIGISFTFFIVMWMAELVTEIAEFNSASNNLVPIIGTILSIILAFSLFWLNNYIGFQTTAKRRIIIALGFTALLFGGDYLIQYSNQPEFDPRPHYNSTIMAPSYLIAPSNNVERFINESNTLFEQANQAAQDSD